MSDTQQIKLWDLPTRLFHWTLAAAVIAAIVTGHVGGNAIEWHGRLGLLVVGLVVFRLVWGFIGSTYARFATFFPTPAGIRRYLKGQWQGVGHNPLGALSVFALLALTACQVGTGLFANDDIAFQGYLFNLAGKDLSDTLSGIHELCGNLLTGLIVLHVAAIVFYFHMRHHNLVRPMITGKAPAPAGTPDAQGGRLVAFIVALVLALAAVWGASGTWLPTPPPTTSNQDW